MLLDWDKETGEYSKRKGKVKERGQLSSHTIEEVLEFPVSGWGDRKIDKTTHALFGVHAQGKKGQGPHEFYYPNYRDGKLVGYKIRSKFKEDDKEVQKGKVEAGTFKCFRGYVGDNKKGLQLFGQNLHDTAPRRVFILGGQEDAMSAYQIVSKKIKLDNPVKPGEIVPGYAFVSPQNGENDVDIKAQLQWFETAKEVILCFDDDDAGRECTEAVATLFPTEKVKIMSMKTTGANDVNQALMTGKGNEWWHSIWKAKPYSPAGIVAFEDAFQAMKERGDWQTIPFPSSFGDLNARTLGGHALGEITNLIAATSIGKSIFTNEMVLSCIEKTDYNVGVITLEADKVEYAEQMNSLALSKRLIEIPHDERDWDEIREAHNKFSGRLYLIEEPGAIKSEKLFFDKINFLINGLDCKMIVLDPATLASKIMRVEDEEEFLGDLLSLIKAKRVSWVNVCHTRKSQQDQKAASEGKELSEEDLKGTGAWIQNGMNNIVLMRDKLNDNDLIKNTTKVKLTKCRRNGKETGVCGYILYDVDTGRLVKGRDPEDIDDD
jgi:hypothetical protein